MDQWLATIVAALIATAGGIIVALIMRPTHRDVQRPAETYKQAYSETQPRVIQQVSKPNLGISSLVIGIAGGAACNMFGIGAIFVGLPYPSFWIFLSFMLTLVFGPCIVYLKYGDVDEEYYYHLAMWPSIIVYCILLFGVEHNLFAGK
jgi:hypothetical protein